MQQEEVVPEIDVQPLSSFEELSPGRAFIEKLNSAGIFTPTEVQARAIPAALSGADLIVQAHTGSGKTIAFVLPLLMKLHSVPKRLDSTFGLVITPTRELALQVHSVIASLAGNVRPVCLIGGAGIREQIRELKKDARIIVGTPGRILDLLQRREVNLRGCRQFVLDEADEMLSMGFLEEVREILRRLPVRRQGFFFSATITPRVQNLSYQFLKSPLLVTVSGENESAEEIEHFYMNVEGGMVADRARALCALIESEAPDSAIIFCNTKSDTELVEVFLRRRGFDVGRLNSDLSQKERAAIMARLRNGTLRILVATDVAARGLDIEDLDLVVNYNIHQEPEMYVHRTGRTGRAGKSGRAVSLIAPGDFSVFHGLRKRLNIEMRELPVPS